MVAHARALLVSNSIGRDAFGLLVSGAHNMPMIGSAQADWQKSGIFAGRVEIATAMQHIKLAMDATMKRAMPEANG